MNLRFRSLLLLAALLPFGGCSRTRPVDRPLSTAVLKEATLEQLLQTVSSNASSLHTLNADIDVDTSVGGKKKGKVTDYSQFSGHLLVRKPDMMRMIGLFPVVRNKLVDMVSTGENFRVSLPSRQKFIIGSNRISKPSDQAIENWRPQYIYEALFVKEVDPQTEQAVLEQSMEVVKDPNTHKDAEQPDYVVIVIRKDPERAYLSRKIVFSRTDLMPHEQMIYDAQGQLVTDVHYGAFVDYSGVSFPSVVQLVRPVEEYGITLTIRALRANEPLTDDKFVLAQPPGSVLVNLDEKSSAQNQPTVNSDTPKKRAQ